MPSSGCSRSRSGSATGVYLVGMQTDCHSCRRTVGTSTRSDQGACASGTSPYTPSSDRPLRTGCRRAHAAQVALSRGPRRPALPVPGGTVRWNCYSSRQRWTAWWAMTCQRRVAPSWLVQPEGLSISSLPTRMSSLRSGEAQCLPRCRVERADRDPRPVMACGQPGKSTVPAAIGPVWACRQENRQYHFPNAAEPVRNALPQVQPINHRPVAKQGGVQLCPEIERLAECRKNRGNECLPGRASVNDSGRVPLRRWR